VRTNAQVLSSRIVTLAEVLQADGFTTLASVSARHLASGGLERGFDMFLAPRLGDLRAYRPADETVAVAIEEIERGPVAKRAFYWFHFFDPHIPYRRHGELHYSGESDSEEFETQARFLVDRHRAHEETYGNVWGLVSAVDQYDDEVRYADTQLSRLYFAFERMGLNDNSLWIFTSDHGEGLSNHELRGHERHIYNEQIKVPLIIYDRGRDSRPQAHQRLVEHVDLLPTVLDFAGVSTSRVPHRGLLAGESLRDLVVRGEHAAPPKLAFSESGTRSGGKNQPLGIAVQDSSYKYVRWADGSAELFEVESDPYEELDLLQGSSADSVASFLAKSIVKWEAAPAARTTGRQRDVDPALYEQLSKLGYIE
jgi:arylsulfatase A-like enzyme